jgi:GNAT superfamily N-acetyltransferase
VRPDEFARAGCVVLEAYRALAGYVSEPDYERELADVATRAAKAVVAVAVTEPEGAIAGCVTYVPDAGNVFAEFEGDDAAGFRMLGVDPTCQGRGAGRALVAWCIDQARAAGRQRLVIHSTPWMERAHDLYLTLGFERRPDLDWQPVPAIRLLGFVLEL